MAKQFRMVPEDAAEAQHIATLLDADVKAQVPELTNADSKVPIEERLKILHQRQGWLYRWHEIAADLAKEEALDKEDAKEPPRNPRDGPASRSARITPNVGGAPNKPEDKKP